MKRLKEWMVAVMLVVMVPALSTAGQDLRPRRLVPVRPLLIEGEVTLITGGTGSPVISPWFRVTRGGTPVERLAVSLNGRRLRETMPGQYAGIRITDIPPRPGLALTFTIEFPKRPLSPLATSKPGRIEGTAAVGSMAVITRPRNKSVLNRKALGKILTITWTGGTPPFQVSLLKTTGGSPLELFSRSGLPLRSCKVSTGLLTAGETYSAGVRHQMDEFSLRFAGDRSGITVDKSSRVVLIHSVFSAFSVR